MWTIRHACYQTLVSHSKVNSFKQQATVSPNRIHPSLSIFDITTYLYRVDFYHFLFHCLSHSLSIPISLPLSLFSATLCLCLFYCAHKFVCLSFHSVRLSLTLTLSNFSPCLFKCVRLADPLSFFIFLSAAALYFCGNQYNIKYQTKR